MRSTSGSMSRSMSLSRTVSSDRSMSIDEERTKHSPESSKFNGSLKDEQHRSSYRERDTTQRYRRSVSRSVSRKRSSSSDSYSNYKNYKNFKSKYTRSNSSSRSYSRGRRNRKGDSYSSSSSYRSRSRSPYRKSSVSRSRTRSPVRHRGRTESLRSPRRRTLRSHRERTRVRRDQERRDRGRRSLRERPRLQDKFTFEEDNRPNGRSRLSEKLNGYRRGSNRETKKEEKVDRKYNTPFLLKVMAQSVSEGPEESVTPEELHVYVWLDSTLRDLVNLIKDISPPTRKRNNTWTFSTNKGEESLELGSVHSFKLNAREDNRTLESLRFKIGSSVNLTFKD